ncbi:MAG: class I SAM-dependent methyltransferase [Propionibacteriaceae bacterium]|nr:class I SAM-dependent methyltransferase [Propionibacteriaceae bacterium]
MNADHVWIPADGANAITQASEYADASSLSAAEALRAQFNPAVAAWAVTQLKLRRKAVSKLGARAANMYFTTPGLEQLTRASVADWRAARVRGLGVSGVIDLSAGLGADALAFGLAGLKVLAVERDFETAAYLTHNLANVAAEIVVGDALQLAERIIIEHPDYAVYLDPARRTGAGRSWRLSDLSPSWEFVTWLLNLARMVVVKLGPGFPLETVPRSVEACWVSDHGDLLELSLWPGKGRRVVRLGRTAVKRVVGLGSDVVGLDAGVVGVPGVVEVPGVGCVVDLNAGVAEVGAIGDEVPIVERTIELYAQHSLPELVPAAPRAYIIEPDPAVIRSGLTPLLGENLAPLHPGIAYFSADQPLDTSLATSFEVLQVLAYREADLKSWVRKQRIGVLEIKCRGLQLDPAKLRRKLRLSGENQATIIISPTVIGTKVFIVRRCHNFRVAT